MTIKMKDIEIRMEELEELARQREMWKRVAFEGTGDYEDIRKFILVNRRFMDKISEIENLIISENWKLSWGVEDENE